MKATQRNSLLTLEPKDWYRFWSKVDKTGGCWFWTSAVNNKGYGQFNIGNHPYLAHRIAFISTGNLIPKGTELDHKCRHANCVNPLHLETVSHKENCARGLGGTSPGSKTGRRHALERERNATHCIHGHLLAGDNLFKCPSDSRGRRRCRECMRIQNQRYLRRERE